MNDIRRMYSRKLFLLSISFLIAFQVNAQIGGLSVSKLNSFCADAVDRHQLIVEPGFSYTTSKKHWNNNSDLLRIYSTNDSLNAEAGLRFRFTYGVSDNLEIGVTVPADMSTSSWGVKYLLFQDEKYGFAAIGGVNYPFGKGAINKKDAENAIQGGLGAVFTWSPTETFSADVTLQAAKYIPEPEYSSEGYFSLSADAGYYLFNGNLLVAAGLGYQKYFSDNLKQYSFTLYPGIAINTGKNFCITLIHSFDLAGRNTDKQQITDVSFTLTLD